MSRNLTTESQPVSQADSQRKAIVITCDGCCRPIEKQYDLFTIMHRLFLVRVLCSRCYTRKTMDYHRRVPNGTGDSKLWRLSQAKTPSRLITRASRHAWAYRSATFPNEPIIQINAARMSWALVLSAVLTIASTLMLIMGIASMLKLLFVFYPIALWMLELRLVSYLRYERHVRSLV